MRTILLFMSLFVALNINAQDKGVKTATIAVKGNCEECKKRIENAADIKGVKLAVWDETTQAVTVTYKTDKVTLEQIEKAIAASGHDVGSIKGNDVSYNKLPSCCKYRDKKCELPKK
ncbi:MAG: heavy-metal-associated domain-containing protein [Bacteroidetes bacterium]|nr:heavy-metal-associated domain-containing protein [Bacteroidota bacterium]